MVNRDGAELQVSMTSTRRPWSGEESTRLTSVVLPESESVISIDGVHADVHGHFGGRGRRVSSAHPPMVVIGHILRRR